MCNRLCLVGYRWWALIGIRHVICHTCVTYIIVSVQVVQDVKYFQRVKWQYMILDEAQAIKSSSRYV